MFLVHWPEKAPLNHCKQEDIEAFYQKVVSSQSPIQVVNRFFHLIECRNTILNVVRNLEKMVAARYCTSIISVLVSDPIRKNVARLVPIDCRIIKQLAFTFESYLRQILSRGILQAEKDTSFAVSSDISERCQLILSSLGLKHIPKDHIDLWRCAVGILDMTVVSYAGAHTHSLGSKFPSLLKPVNIPFIFSHTPQYIFRRRHFRCLNKFLSCQSAWVLERDFGTKISNSTTTYCLSTDATTFSDIWGPMWESRVDSDPMKILHYNVGNGKILPLQRPSTKLEISEPGVNSNEIYCHWISDEKSRFGQTHFGSTGQTLSPDDILLIGANVRLRANPLCSCHLGAVKEQLRDSGSLHEVGTIPKSRYQDS